MSFHMVKLKETKLSVNLVLHKNFVESSLLRITAYTEFVRLLQYYVERFDGAS